MAKLRAEMGWTQAQLAERIALSRVGVSHVEAGISMPSERTVTLLAGVFGREPYGLVAGTDYPVAKAERLPLVTARHTEVSHQLAVLEAVVGTAARVAGRPGERLLEELRGEWRSRLAGLLAAAADPEERRRVKGALRRLG